MTSYAQLGAFAYLGLVALLVVDLRIRGGAASATRTAIHFGVWAIASASLLWLEEHMSALSWTIIALGGSLLALRTPPTVWIGQLAATVFFLYTAVGLAAYGIVDTGAAADSGLPLALTAVGVWTYSLAELVFESNLDEGGVASAF